MADRGADQELLDRLAAMWEERDPMPPGLVERTLVTLATEDLDVEYELLHLMSRSEELAGARGASDAVTVSFSSDAFSLLLRVTRVGERHRRVDGWVSPPRDMHVEVSQGTRRVGVDVDENGRFEIPRLASGASRFWLSGEHAGGSDPEWDLFATPTFEL